MGTVKALGSHCFVWAPKWIHISTPNVHKSTWKLLREEGHLQNNSPCLGSLQASARWTSSAFAVLGPRFSVVLGGRGLEYKELQDTKLETWVLVQILGAWSYALNHSVTIMVLLLLLLKWDEWDVFIE